MRKLERYVSKIPLDFEYIINGAIETCEPHNRRIIVVGGFFKLPEYFRIKKAINERSPKIKVSYKLCRLESCEHYSKGPYFIEVDCFEFKD
tara:strand:+ start:3531 stop:3803 length:273 start_codon:yes stop_codon:yes gene_type:complete